MREHNFSINGLEGFDIRGKTIGIVGTGNIGTITAKILAGFSPARLLGYDVIQRSLISVYMFVNLYTSSATVSRSAPVCVHVF